MLKAALWKKLQDYRFERGQPELTFAARLSAETTWPIEYTLGVIQEYLRFVYLMAISKSPLTPSTMVDEVWHLHLSYTSNYWDELCGKVIGKPIHHMPTMGGADESMKFKAAYENTLTLYKREFEIEPPAGYWPKTNETSLVLPKMRTIDGNKYWVVSKEGVMRTHMVGGFAIAFVGGLMFPNNSNGQAIALFTGIVMLFASIVYGSATGLLKNQTGGGANGGCSGGHSCGGHGCGSSCGGH